MSDDALEVIRPGLGASIQDRGRPGLAMFGVPPGGAMDDHAAGWANRLLGNPPGAPVLELLLYGACLEARRDVWIAVTGGDAGSSVPTWRPVLLRRGEQLAFAASRTGVWTYVAASGGFDAPRYFGSASVYPRGGIGRLLARGDVLACRGGHPPEPGVSGPGPAGAAARRRDYTRPPLLRVWPGPERDRFAPADLDGFFRRGWTVSSESDRVGYRLSGVAIASGGRMASEPVLVGSIQVPPSGQPIVTMRDGPTVGGYPRIGLVDPGDLSWLAQCRPGAEVQFTRVASERPPGTGGCR